MYFMDRTAKKQSSKNPKLRFLHQKLFGFSQSSFTSAKVNKMKKQKRTKPQPKKSRRRLLMICIAGVLLAVAATTVVSRHLASQRESKSVAEAAHAKYR